MRRPLCSLCFLIALLPGVAPPATHAGLSFEARASSKPNEVRESDGLVAPAPLLGWGIGKWFVGSGGRTRVVQFCVVTMCIALFIMMRKLT